MDGFFHYYDKVNDYERKLMFAILHWFLLGRCYEYEWDRFAAQYYVFDAICKISGFNKSHSMRPERIAKHFDIPIPDFAQIYEKPSSDKRNVKTCKLAEIRNELFHEAKYAGQPIGYNYPNQNFDLGFPRFNLQLIISIVGLKTEILTTGTYDKGRANWRFK